MVLRDVRKTYPPDVRAVAGVSLAVPLGAHLALLGPSGCGKTTTLMMLAGLETPDSGQIWIDGRQVDGGQRRVPPEGRGVGMVFQDYALFPFLTVAQNVGFALTGQSGRERARIVGEMLELVGLPGLDRRYPHEISGGQQQRVALARALAPSPRLMLLDEPFSNLDAGLRQQVRSEVRAILKQRQVTTIFVTHDQAEALSAADLVGVMRAGHLEQVGTPEDLYRAPRTRAVAESVGEAAFLDGEAAGESVTCALGRLPLAVPTTGPVSVMLRPEAVMVAPSTDASEVVGRVVSREFYGRDVLLVVTLPSGDRVRARVGPGTAAQPGDAVTLTVSGSVVALARA